MSPSENKVYIRAIIARLYILLGILFMLIFILGAVVLKDYMNLIYCLASSLLIVMGYKALKTPYAIFNEKELILFNLFGKERIKYTFSSKNDIKVKNQHLYLEGKKMKINKWFVKNEEWKRLIKYYSPEDENAIFHELQDD